jgi:LPXTG-site transpeptidase (sortase) family protein
MISRPPRDRPHPLRLAALVILFAGIVLMAVFAGGMVQGVRDQQALMQTWNADAANRHFGAPAIDPSLQHPVNGVDFAIRVPRLGYSAAVKEGVTTSVLYASPGHYPETVWPGDQGTVGVAAHNVYWINFPQLTPGDEIDLETRYGTYKYHVTGSAIVNPDNRSVLIPNAPGYHLTLTTCWPLWAGAFATQRYVIFSDQYTPPIDSPLGTPKPASLP